MNCEKIIVALLNENQQNELLKELDIYVEKVRNEIRKIKKENQEVDEKIQKLNKQSNDEINKHLTATNAHEFELDEVLPEGGFVFVYDDINDMFNKKELESLNPKFVEELEILLIKQKKQTVKAHKLIVSLRQYVRETIHKLTKYDRASPSAISNALSSFNLGSKKLSDEIKWHFKSFL